MISSYGSSDSTVGSQATVSKIIEAWRKSSPERQQLMPVPWDELPEEVLINRTVYEDFATHLVFEYISAKTQKPLGEGSVGDYIGMALTLARNRCEARGTSPAAQTFFKCHLKECQHDEAGRWYKGLRSSAEGAAWKRDVKAGEDMDKSTVPIYLDAHVVPM